MRGLSPVKQLRKETEGIAMKRLGGRETVGSRDSLGPGIAAKSVKKDPQFLVFGLLEKSLKD